MIRHSALVAVLGLSLSCASSGSTNGDTSGSPALAEGTHRVIYSVQCLTPVRREGLVTLRDCEFEVSYRAADGMKFERRNSRWRYEFISVSGEPAKLVLDRRGWTQGRVEVSVFVDNQRTREFLEDGEAGPITLTVDMT